MKDQKRLSGRICCLLTCLLLSCSACGRTNAGSRSAPDSNAASQTELSAPDASAADETQAPETEPETDAPTEAPTEPPTDPEPAGAAIDWDAMQQEMQALADKQISDSLDSFQFAVMDAGKIVVSGTAGKSVSKESVYGIASSSKMMAVAAVMQLVDEGKVALDEPVTTYIPEFRMQDPRYQDITVRMLMNHSSGLYGNTSADSWKLGTFGDTAAHDRFLSRLSEQKLRSAPGAYSIYCNDGFTLLELLCEEVSGMSYSEYLHSRIFTPLGMEHTYSPMDQFDTAQLAPVYFGGFGTALPAMTTDAAQGGMFSTAEDLCRFGKTFTDAGSGILSSESVQAMAAPEYLNGIWCEPGYSTMNYGLGWDAVDLYPFSELGIKAVTKNGDVILSGSQMIVLPEYNLVAAATGSGSSNSVSKNFLIRSLLRILQEKGLIGSLPTKPALTVTGGDIPEDVLAYAGTYVRSWGAFEISFSGSQMIRTALPGGSQTTFRHIGNGHFTDDDSTDYWFMEQDGHRYEVSRAWSESCGVSLPTVMIQGTMTEKTALSDDAKSAWRSRAGKSYLLYSEPYDSLGYVYPSYGLALPGCQLTLTVDPDKSPFWRGLRITGPDTAENAAEVPIIGSTNAVDAQFVIEDGTEVLHLTNGLSYRSTDGIPSLSLPAEIAVSGEALWYRTSGQTLHCNIPAGCAVAVYDSDLKCTVHTIVTPTDTLQTKSGGYVAFLGNGTISVE